MSASRHCWMWNGSSAGWRSCVGRMGCRDSDGVASWGEAPSAEIEGVGPAAESVRLIGSRPARAIKHGNLAVHCLPAGKPPRERCPSSGAPARTGVVLDGRSPPSLLLVCPAVPCRPVLSASTLLVLAGLVGVRRSCADYWFPARSRTPWWLARSRPRPPMVPQLPRPPCGLGLNTSPVSGVLRLVCPVAPAAVSGWWGRTCDPT